MSDQGPTPPPAPNFVPNNQPSNAAMPLASMICGILGLIGVLPVIGSILGLVFGNIAKKQTLNSNEETFVKIGVITSWVGLALTIAVFLLIVVFGLLALSIPFIATT